MSTFADKVFELVADRNCDLTLRQINVLLFCDRERERPDMRTVRHMAKEMKLSKPAITRSLDRLASEGLGARQRDKVDRRLIIFNLSSAGRQLAAFMNGGKAA